MDDNRLKFGVGVLVIAAIGIGIILTFLFGAVPRVLTGEYKLLVSFPSAEGISTNTPVLLRGVEIGRVVDKELRVKEEDVLLTLGIDSEYQDTLSHEYVPRIGTGSVITGDSKLEFVKGSEEQLTSIHQNQLDEVRKQPYTDEQYLSYGDRTSDPFNLMFELEEEMRSTMDTIRRAGSSLETVGANVNQLVGDAQTVVVQADEDLGDLSEDARQALIEFQGAMRNVRQLLEDPELQESLRQSLAELPEVLSEAQATLQSGRETFQSFENVGNRFERVGAEAERTVQNVDRTVDSVRKTIQSAEGAVKNIETITEPIAESSEDLVRQALASLSNLDRTLRQVETFGETLNQSDGTVRRLLEDEELYWKIRRTVENIEQASARVRPILDDVRVFSDKIARDPRQLGVRGALTKRPTGLGLK